MGINIRHRDSTGDRPFIPGNHDIINAKLAQLMHLVLHKTDTMIWEQHFVPSQTCAAAARKDDG